MAARTRVAGIAALGRPAQYRPVVYRVYYEDPSSGQRVSALALARSGQASVLATLAEAYRDEGSEVSASLAVIVPITLAAEDQGILERLESAAGQASGDPAGAAEELCNFMLRRAAEAVDLAQSMKILEEEVVNDAVALDFIIKNGRENREVRGNVKLELNVARRASVIRGLDVERASGPEMLTPTEILHEGFVLPILCRYRGARLRYSHYVRRGARGINGGAVDLVVDLYVAVTPLAMAAARAGGGLVVFRDARPSGRFNMGAIHRAAMLESVNAVLAGEAAEASGWGSSTSIVFYDVTTGLNVVVATLTQIMGIATDVYIARLAAKGKSVRALRVYMYSGDPVTIQSGAEALTRTARDANISYNYTKLADIGLADGADSGWVEAVASNLRAHIDRLVARLRGARSESDDSLLALALQGIAHAYLAKLGLIHWSLAGLRRFHRGLDALGEPLRELVTHRPIPATLLGVSRRGDIIFVNYQPPHASQSSDGLLSQLYFTGGDEPVDPDAVVEALRLAEALSLLACRVTVYSSLSWDDEGGSFYIDLDRLHGLIAGRPEADAAAKIFASIVEPGTRTVLEHELKRVISDGESYLAEALRHWTTGGRGGERQFELDVGSLREACCRSLRELSGAEGTPLASGEVALETVDGNACIIGPAQPGQGRAGSECPSISTAELRNFVAHMGFTRLLTGWGFLVADDCRGGCKIKGIVVRDTQPSIECIAARLAGFT